MSDVIERRVVAHELRTGEGDSGPILDGHAAVFNHAEDFGLGFMEVVRPGAFAKTIQEADVRALFNHDPNYVLGRTKNGTLKLSEDDIGLRYIASPPDTQWARDLHTSVKRGDISQSSYAFQVVKQRWTTDEETGTELREILEVKLYDVSPVTYPAFPTTDVSARALEACGLDMNVISALVFKRDRGIALTVVDHAAIRSAMNVLAGFLPGEPVKRDHSADADDDASAGALRARRARARLASFRA